MSNVHVQWWLGHRPTTLLTMKKKIQLTTATTTDRPGHCGRVTAVRLMVWRRGLEEMGEVEILEQLFGGHRHVAEGAQSDVTPTMGRLHCHHALVIRLSYHRLARLAHSTAFRFHNIYSKVALQ